MKKYNFDKVVDRRNLNSYKWDVNRDEISLSVADSDFECFPEIKEALLEKVDDACFGYTYVPDEYYDAYIHWWASRYNVELKRENFVFSTSMIASIDVILKRVCVPGEKVTMLTPIYNVFFNCIKNNGLKLLSTSFIYEDYRFEIDFDLLEKNLKEAKVFIFCNPHNPVGKRFDEEEVNKIVSLCKKYDVYLISDEIHCDYDYNDKKYVSVLLSKDNDYDKLITLFSPGKTFNVAGLHSSVIYIKDKKLKGLVQEGVYQDDVGEPNYFAIAPVIAAYTKGERYVEELNEYIGDNRRELKDYFVENIPNLKVIDNDATYLLWVDISYYKIPSHEFVERLRKEVGVILPSGEIYGEEGKYFVRVNLATNRDTVMDFCKRMDKFVRGLEK